MERDIILPEPNMFVYTAAHDLRAPLMSVKGLIDIMRRVEETQHLDHYFDMMEQSMEKMNQSIENIISQSKHELSAAHVHPIDFKKLAKESMESLLYLAASQAVRMDLLVEQKQVFCSHPNLVLSIINNLLSNAIRYRDAAKTSFVFLHVVVDSQCAKISVKDNGIGIEKEMQDKIFDKFFRAKDDPQGSGLGLFILKSALDNLGGTVEVQSTIGQGTKFIIRIPNTYVPGKPSETYGRV
jgi:signal transduction histidine kinase